MSSREKPLKVALFPYYPPYCFKDDSGEIEGILIDYLSKVEEKIGYKFERVEYDNFSNVLKDAKEDKIDLILEIQKTDPRDEYLNFYDHLFFLQFVIVNNNSDSFEIKLENLKDKTVAVPTGFGIIDYLKANFPSITIVDGCKNDLECLQWIQEGKAEYYIGPKAVTSYFINSQQLNDLKIVGTLRYEYRPGIAVIKTKPELNSIILKGTKSVSFNERKIIKENWLFSEIPPFYL